MLSQKPHKRWFGERWLSQTQTNEQSQRQVFMHKRNHSSPQSHPITLTLIYAYSPSSSLSWFFSLSYTLLSLVYRCYSYPASLSISSSSSIYNYISSLNWLNCPIKLTLLSPLSISTHWVDCFDEIWLLACLAPFTRNYCSILANLFNRSLISLCLLVKLCLYQLKSFGIPLEPPALIILVSIGRRVIYIFVKI